MPYIRHISARRHKLVVHFLDGRVLKGSTYKLDPDRKGFYLIPINPDPENPEVWVEFQKVKAIFYVKDFDGKPVEEDFHREYVPEGCEITVKFKDGEIVKGFALQYDESKPTFFVDIPDPSSNNYCMLVNRAAVDEITLGRTFRKRKLRNLIDTPVKKLIMCYYYENPSAEISLAELATTIDRTLNSVKRDIEFFVQEGLAEYTDSSKSAVRFLPVTDDEVRTFIEEHLPECRRVH